MIPGRSYDNGLNGIQLNCECGSGKSTPRAPRQVHIPCHLPVKQLLLFPLHPSLLSSFYAHQRLHGMLESSHIVTIALPLAILCIQHLLLSSSTAVNLKKTSNYIYFLYYTSNLISFMSHDSAVTRSSIAPTVAEDDDPPEGRRRMVSLLAPGQEALQAYLMEEQRSSGDAPSSESFLPSPMNASNRGQTPDVYHHPGMDGASPNNMHAHRQGSLFRSV